VTVITPGAGCPITSTATLSTTGATGRFTFRAAFFAGAGFGFALATVRFAALATLRGLPRLAEFSLRSFARFCGFDCFLRLAMIDPPVSGSGLYDDGHSALGHLVLCSYRTSRRLVTVVVFLPLRAAEWSGPPFCV
jgi:hypothetical protein